jgi:DNA-binding transcriptional ArsR family regulator
MMEKLSDIEICILMYLYNNEINNNEFSFPLLRHYLQLYGFDMPQEAIMGWLRILKRKGLVNMRIRRLIHTAEVFCKISNKGKGLLKRYGIE